MKSIQRKGDQIEIELEPGEASLLASLPGLIAEGLRSARPMADDPSLDRELHTLLDSELAARRMERTRGFVAKLSRADEMGACLALTLDEAEGWLAVLTDLRLALATQLGIQDDADAARLGRSDPVSLAERQYLYLSHLQSALLSRGFGVE